MLLSFDLITFQIYSRLRTIQIMLNWKNSYSKFSSKEYNNYVFRGTYITGGAYWKQQRGRCNVVYILLSSDLTLALLKMKYTKQQQPYPVYSHFSVGSGREW